VELIDSSGAVWQNWTAAMTVGTTSAKTTLAIGSNAAAPTGDVWSGALPSGNNDWSMADNWADVSVPTSTSTVVFDATDAGGVSHVDATFQGTIAGLTDTGQTNHTLELDRTLQVNGPVSILTGNTETTGSLSLVGGQLNLHLTSFDVGLNTIGSGLARGYLLLSDGAVIDAADVNAFSVGRVVSGSIYGKADGSLILSSDDTINLGTLAAPATLNIGWNQSTADDGWGGNTTKATGLLDTSTGTLTAQLSTLNVGLTSGRGTAEGTFIMGSGTSITTNIVNVGMGGTSEGGATGTFDYRGGTLTFTGTDTSLNFGSGSLHVADGKSITLGATTNRLDALRIGYNTSWTDLADSSINLAAETLIAYLDNELSVGRVDSGSIYGKADGSLILSSDDTINLGTLAAPATLNIGWNQNTTDSDYPSYANTSSAVGLLDASRGTFTAQLSTLNVGLTAWRGTAQGTLIMGSGASITANTVNVGMGGTYEGGATGTLDYRGGTLAFTGTDSSLNFGSGSLEVTTVATLTLGSTTNRLANLRIGYNVSGVDTADSSLDLTDDTLTAYLGNELSIGRVANTLWMAKANGSLILSNDTINLGTLAAPATLNIGWNQNTTDSDYPSYANTSSAVGLLHTGGGTFTAQLSTLNVGLTAWRGTAQGTLFMGSSTNITANTVNIGLTAWRGTAQGTLIMGSGANITANTVNIGMGCTIDGGATGTLDYRGGTLAFTGTDSSLNFGSGSLDVATAKTLTLGTTTNRLANLRIGYNLSGVDTADSSLDLTNDTLIAYLGTELSIGRVTNYGWQAKADGSLILSSDDTINLGTLTAPATLNIGWNQNTTDSDYPSYANTSSAVGLLDASRGTFTAQLSTLNVGLTSGRGTAEGTFIMGSGTSITTNIVNVGVGDTPEGGATGVLLMNNGSLHTDTLNLHRGVLDSRTGTLTVGASGTLSANTVEFSGGLLAVQNLDLVGGTFHYTNGTLLTDTINGNITQQGGTFDHFGAPGETVINGNYSLASAGTLHIDLFGADFTTSSQRYDRLNVNGTINLNTDDGSKGVLDLHLGYSPTVGTTFMIVDNDGTDNITNRFRDLLEGSTFSAAYGSQTVTFQITYYGGDGNDVVLTVKSVSGTAPTGLALNGTAGDDVLNGSINNDSLAGLAGNDLIYGDSGDDTLDGGSGMDVLAGGVGNDTYIVDNRGDLTMELASAGTDTVQASVTHTLGANIEHLTLTGTAAINGTGNDLANTLTGNGAANTLRGLNDNDTLNGGAGADTLIGGGGDDLYLVDNRGDTITELEYGGTDTVQVSFTFILPANVEHLKLTGSAAINGTGNRLPNSLTGNTGANVLVGNEGNDHLYGLGGNDTLIGGIGYDILVGGLGDDLYEVYDDDWVFEDSGEGTDTVQAYTTYTLWANIERLTLIGTAAINGTGNDAANILTGNDAANTLNGMGGNDTLIGNGGNDTYVVDTAADVTTELLDQGTDTVQASVTRTLGANLENLVLTGTAASNGTGNELANTLTGNTADNTLYGLGGNDLLSGGGGADTLIGGLGNDTYGVDSTDDVTTELAGEGTDTVRAALTHTLTANIEHLTLIGTAAINGTGNDLANTLTGNDAANVLVGGAGNDTLLGNGGNDFLNGATGADIMSGGTGNDVYVVDNSGDVITELAGEGADSVQASITLTLGVNIEHLTLIGTAAINGTGNELANTLTGNTANNVLAGAGGNDTLVGNGGNDTLSGGTGADTMRGGTGNDVYVVDNSGDVTTELAGEGTDTVQASITLTLGANIEHLTLIGTAAINGTGNELANTITGNTANNVLAGAGGNDTLVGNGGNDTLSGGTGADTMRGGTGNDVYVVDNSGDVTTELAGEGSDTVQAYITHTLGANIENLTIIGSAAINGTGNELANTITGNDAANILAGAVGNDTLLGHGGNDFLNGGTGADTMRGGTGNDVYVVDNSGDVTTELAGEGSDTVQAYITHTLGANIENLTLIGTAAINGTGNALANSLTGNGAANTLSGSGGNDTLMGGYGNDTLIGGAGQDVFVFNTLLDAAANLDTVTDFVSGEDSIRLDRTVFAQLSLGSLSDSVFQASASGMASDLDDRILYNTATGALLYDADGSNSGLAVQFARLDPRPATLSAADFNVVA
jgi:Ca2+-binding RTX toxin-like protein